MRKALVFLIFLICIASTYAALDIVSLNHPVNKYENDMDMSFQILNSSGKLLNSSAGEVDCRINIYNDSNKLILINELVADNEIMKISTAPTNKTIRYTYNIWCNSSEGEFGYLDSYYDITISGKIETETAKILPALVALLPLFFAIIFLVGAATLGEKHNVVRVFLFLLSPIFVIVSLHFATLGIVKFYNFPELQDAVGSTLYWVVLLLGVLIAYFIIYGISVMIHTAAQKKEEELEY